MLAPLVAILCVVASCVIGTTPPNIIVIIGDDVGWSGVSYHNTTKATSSALPEIRTPNIDFLMGSGIDLTRHYVYRFCSPSRSSFQSGRLPVHVNTLNVAPEFRNASNPVTGYQGIARTMTGIATKMRSVGYSTHMTGKWDAGMATIQHTPIGRGFDSWLGYFHHANDYFTEGLPLKAIGKLNICFNQFKDLWGPFQGPAKNYTGKGIYEEEIFTNRTLAVIKSHDISSPLFLVHSFHLVHTPLEVPTSYLSRFSFIDNEQRKHYSAMTSYMDDQIGIFVKALKAKGEDFFNNTLIIFFADNGGAIYNPAGGNNHPLKGGKMSDWEGGIRSTAFVSGGYVPKEKRGTSSSALLHVSDWYRTFCHLAGGVDPEDAAAVGLPKVDGIDVSSILFGNSSDDDIITAANQMNEDRVLHISEQTIIVGQYKLISGIQAMSGWTGALYPNNTGTQPTYIPLSWNHDCKDGELYNIIDDPNEHENVAAIYPEIMLSLQNKLLELNKNNFNPNRGRADRAACVQARKVGGYYGPWVDLPL